MKISYLLLIPALLSGCARDISSNSYSEATVGEASSTFQGVIVNVRQIKVTGGDKLSDNTAGIGLGALAGGLAGGAFGRGYGQLAAAAGGAVLGGTAGAFAEKALNEQQALEYTVRLNNGEIKTVVQGLDNPIAVGQPVFLSISYQGKQARSRVVADNSGTSQVQPYATPANNVIINKRY